MLQHFYQVIENGRARTLGDAINLYEEECYRRRQREENAQILDELEKQSFKQNVQIVQSMTETAALSSQLANANKQLADMKKELEKLVKDCGIKSACITNSTAFFKDVPASAVVKLRELVDNATFYQYRSDSKSPFDEAGINTSTDNHNKHKNGGDPHTIECSKNISVNFYNLRRAKKKAKETREKNTYNFRHGSKAEGRKLRRGLKVKANAVNKKPTQVKEVKQKAAKQAA